MIKVVKFGGSSLADAGQIKKAAAIVTAEPARRYVVVSAPGKRYKEDEKVTDLLLRSCKVRDAGKDPLPVFQKIRDRFAEIINGLGISLDLSEAFDEVYRKLMDGAGTDYMASRGEHFNARIMAAYLQVPFVDAAEGIFFDADGQLDAEKTQTVLGERLSSLERAVVPGFYGTAADGTVKTFSRGGSDITGSICARAVKADLYENWTDVSGMLMADPRVVDDPEPITLITYRELRELSYMGASVLHEDAIFPVRVAGIPINIRNTNRPYDSGTMIVPQANGVAGQVTGIAGKTGFTAIYIEKDRMNAEIGFGRRVLEVLEDQGVCFEHLPSGIDTMSVVVNSADIAEKKETILQQLQQSVCPDHMTLYEDLALIAVVGRGMIRAEGTASRIFAALATAHVNIRMIDQDSSEMNIIIGIRAEDYSRAIRVIYAEFAQGGKANDL